MSTASIPNQSDESSNDGSPKSKTPTMPLGEISKAAFSSWPDFLAHLKARKQAAALHDLWPGRRVALQWGLPALSDETTVTEPLVRAVQRLAAGCRVKDEDASLVNLLLDEVSLTEGGDRTSGEFSSPQISAIQCLALATLLPQLAYVSEEGIWRQALTSLIAMSSKNDSADSDDPLVRQWLNVELPLLLSYQFPELPECKALAESAFDVLIVEQEELLDNDGTMAAASVGYVPAFLATWTRSIILAQRLDLKLDGQSQEKWEWFLRFAMRLLRKDGTTMLAQPQVAAMPELFAAAVATSTDKEDRSIARLVIPTAIDKTTKANKEHKKRTKPNPKSMVKTIVKTRAEKKPRILVDHGTYSEWAGVAVLQTDWSPKSPRVPIVFDEGRFEMEVCRGRTLFHLQGHPDVSLNGKPLQRTDDWEEVCWYSDEDVDYLEVEVHYENDVRLQRQICLLRADDALFIADAVLTDGEHRIDYEVSLNLAESIGCLHETENNEIYLRDSKQKIRCLLLPLGLSEWKAARNDNEIKSSDDAVSLKQAVMGRNLYSAWFVDLSPKRSVKPRTWRPLTVAEGLEIVSPEVAHAFRIRVGDQQWVIYRSLGEVGNRTFLGQNRNCEFFIGRFKENGDVDELISIE